MTEPAAIRFSQLESEIAESKVQNLLAKGVIEKCQPSGEQLCLMSLSERRKIGGFVLSLI